MRLVVVVLLTAVVDTINCVGTIRPVTNEDIRDAILSVVHMIRSTEDKLERHEYRERALGDQIKKALTTIDKRQKVLDPVKGTLSRLDERLAAVETILMQKDERERIQLQKTNDLVEQIHRNLPKMFETLKNDITSSFPHDEPRPLVNSPSKTDLDTLQKEIETRIDNVSQNVVRNIEQIREDNKNNIRLNVHASQNLEDVKRHLNNSEQVLEKYEHKLSEYNNHKDKNDVQANILQAIEKQKTNVEQILTSIKTMLGKVPKVAEATDLLAVKNDALKALEQLKKDILHQISAVDVKVGDSRKSAEQNSAKLQKTIEAVDSKAKGDPQPKILQAVEQQKSNIEQILSNVKTILSKIPGKMPDAADIQATKNEALQSLDGIRKQVAIIDSSIAESRLAAERNTEKLQKAIDSVDAKTKQDLQPKILQSIEQQKPNLDHILSNIKAVQNKIADHGAAASDAQDVKNEALKMLQQIRNAISEQTAHLDGRLVDGQRRTNESNAILHKAIMDSDAQKAQKDLQPAILQALEQQKTNSEHILTNIKAVSHKIPNRAADVMDVQDVKNEALKTLEQVRNTILAQTAHLERKLEENHKKSNESNAILHKAIAEYDVRKTQQDLQPAILQAVELQKANGERILSNVQILASKVPNQIADAPSVENVKTTLEQILKEVAMRTAQMEDKFKDFQKLSEQSNGLQQKVLQDIREVSSKISNLAETKDVAQATNEALKALEQIGNRVIGSYDLINKKLEEVQSDAEQNNITLHKQIETIPSLQPAILQAIDLQNKNVLSSIKTITDKLSNAQPSNPEDKNETFHSLHQLKDEVLGQTLLLNNKIAALHALSEKNAENLQKTIVESGEISEQLNTNVATNLEKLSNSVRSLGKLEQLLVKAADGISDTKRRVEYGVQQIQIDVGAIIKKHAKEVNSTINTRFDNFELALLDAEHGAITNLSSRISGEIDQVWRQIGIMHQQMGENTETLERIQAQTDSHINGSTTTMDNMRGKVTQITSSMSEVDDNLNYLLGRLSLVTQEFNRIKSGLGEALDQIRSSFTIVQQKLQEKGPGPHPIVSSDETEGPAYNQTRV